MAGLSRTAIDKLGDRLRSEGSSLPENLDLLQQWRGEHDVARSRVHAQLRSLDLFVPVTVSSRLKTSSTIVSKLQIQAKMRLSQMGDVAGVRVVMTEGSRASQDRIGLIVRAVYPKAKLKDRRATPSHQYRAVHLEVECDGFDVEVQVRTPLQHQWAELVEKLGDAWGRGIRYGELPENPKQRVEGGSTREDVLTELFEISEAIHQAEVRQGFAEEFDELVKRLGASGPEALRTFIESILSTTKEEAAQELGNARDLLRALAGLNVAGGDR